MICRPIRVLHVTDTLGMGGAETWMLELVRHWSGTRAVKIDFLATSGNRGLFDDEVIALGARIFYLRYSRTNLGAFTRGFRKILRDNCYDAIHDHSDFTAGWRLLLGIGRLPKVRISHVHTAFSHVHASYSVNPARRVTAATGRALTLRLATHICGTSAQALRAFGFEPGRSKPAVSVLHCGFDIKRFNGPREEDRVAVRREFGLTPKAKIILFAGRLDPDLSITSTRNQKNSWLAVLIARAAVQSDPDACLLMAGAGGTQRAMIEAEIASWGLADKLRLVGVRRDIARLMRAADVLLFPSSEEGLGMVAVEAQAAGLPVVASSAIPDEARVIEPLYKTVDLSEPPERWASEILITMAGELPVPEDCRAAIELSDFSITSSAARLTKIYASGQK